MQINTPVFVRDCRIHKKMTTKKIIRALTLKKENFEGLSKFQEKKDPKIILRIRSIGNRPQVEQYEENI